MSPTRGELETIRQPDGEIVCERCLIPVEVRTRGEFSIGGSGGVVRIAQCPNCRREGIDTSGKGPYRPAKRKKCPSCGELQRLSYRGFGPGEGAGRLSPGEFVLPAGLEAAANDVDGCWKGQCGKCRVTLAYIEVDGKEYPSRATLHAPQILECSRLQDSLEWANRKRKKGEREMGEREREKLERLIDLFREYPSLTAYARTHFGFFKDMAILAERGLGDPELALTVTQLGLAVGEVTDRQRENARRRVARLRDKVSGAGSGM